MRILKSDIFQAAHHGADTHESNSVDLIGKVRPSYAVLSAGNHEGDQHPKSSVVERLLSVGTLVDTGQFHKVRLHNPAFIPTVSKCTMSPSLDGTFKTYAHECSRYLWASTSLGIYGTNGFCQGGVSFSWESGLIKVDYKGRSYPTAGESITETLTRLPSLPAPAASSLAALDLSGLGLANPHLSRIIRRICQTRDTSKTLEVLNIRGNQITDISDADLMQIDDLPLVRLDLSSNPLDDVRKVVIQGRFQVKLSGLSIDP